MCERKRELEVDAEKKAAEARDRVVQVQLAQLPEHQQQLLQVRAGVDILPIMLGTCVQMVCSSEIPDSVC